MNNRKRRINRIRGKSKYCVYLDNLFAYLEANGIDTSKIKVVDSP